MCAKLQVPQAPRLTAEISEEASEALALRARIFSPSGDAMRASEGVSDCTV